ncbi:MAG TPA: ATP synthase F0 subunit A, partial [Ktedonobacter sp.]|nr:ATP synthase F0 subunit A [Ktedonobacter sp.]HCP75816.1 ATP synthase F0 subunit A [Ktedonobacter sp.]
MGLWKLLEIKIQPDVIFYLGPIPVTNTLLCTWLSILALAVFFFFATRRRALIPSGIQNVAEYLIEFLLGLVEGVSGKEKGRKFFPLVATFFIFILVSNLLDVIPGVDTIGTINHDAIKAAHVTSQPLWGFLLFGDLSDKLIPWIRPATSDLNLNFAMALIAVITCQVFGFYTLGPLEHLGKYINLKTFFQSARRLNFGGMFQGLIEFFVGVIDIISELSRILSLAFRLFGNIFAGSAVLAVFAFILPFVSDVVFIPLELFVAFVQALVFGLLTLVYLEMATTGHAHTDESEQEAHAEFERNEEKATATA